MMTHTESWTLWLLVVLARTASVVFGDGVYDSRCNYPVSNAEFCTSYPFAENQVRCFCPEDNGFMDWFCCSNGPLLFDESLDPVVHPTSDCWCEGDFKTLAWVVCGTLYGIGILATAVLIGFQLHDQWKWNRAIRGGEHPFMS